MNFVDADYITIRDNVQVLKDNPNPTGEWNVSLPSRILPINTTVRIVTIGQVLHSSGSPEAIGNLSTGEHVMMSDLKKAPSVGSDVFTSNNIVMGIIIIAITYFLYRKFKK